MSKQNMQTLVSKFCRRSLSAALAVLATLSTFASWAVPAQAAACTLGAPRLPAHYARLPGARQLPVFEREHRLDLTRRPAKDAKQIEARIEERALGADSRCDLVVTVSELISSGGDADVLSTLYLARPGGDWQRVGAASARHDDSPSLLNLVHKPNDELFVFSDWQALMLRDRPGFSYLVTWSHERVANGARGYRLLELDRGAATLRSLDIWEGMGAKVYTHYKSLKSDDGRAFDPTIEQAELRQRCTDTGVKPALLTQACLASTSPR